MNNIDEILESIKTNDIDIPIKIQNRITQTLRNKRKNVNYLRRFVLASISIFLTIICSFGVYAVTGGEIEGMPAFEWLGIKFSNKYFEYKQPVENQIIKFEDTTVELVSTLCNEGLTILEFDLKLSENDYKKLKIDESIVTDKYLKAMENNKKTERNRIIGELKNEYLNEEYMNGNHDVTIDDLVIPEEEINSKYEERIAQMDLDIEKRKKIKFIPALSLNYYQVGGVYNYDVFNLNSEWYASIYIDDIPYYIRNFERIEKVSDYEYKIYILYSISDDILSGKNDFKITLKNNKLVSIANWNDIGWNNDCQRFANNKESEMMNIPVTDTIDLPNEIEIQVSKNNILKDSVIIDNPNIKSEFRNITHTVEKVVVSPLQIIVKINHSATQQASNAYANRYLDNPNIEHLPLTREYKVYDANGNELSCFGTTNKNTLIYADGTREDYDYHDIPNKKYSNATWENISNLLIENTNTDYIKIVPIEIIRNPVVESDDSFGEIAYEMEPIIIDLK